MSPLKLGTLIAGIAVTVLIVITRILEAAAHEQLLPPPLATLFDLAAITTWLGHISAHCRDTVIAHIGRTTTATIDAIDAAVEDAHSQGATAARIDTLAQFGNPSPVSPAPLRRPTRLGMVDTPDR